MTPAKAGQKLQIGIAPAGLFRDEARLLLDSIDVGDGTPWDEIVADLDRDHAQLWIVTEGGDLLAAAVTRLTMNDFCEIWLCAGSRLEEWMDDLVAMIREWSVCEGRPNLRLIGRPGWKKVLPAWQTRGVILELVA